MADADGETLVASNDRRLRALAERGMPVPAEQTNALRIICYLEVLLGDDLARAEEYFEVRLSRQIDAVEPQADQLEAAMKQTQAKMRQQQLIAGLGATPIPPNGGKR